MAKDSKPPKGGKGKFDPNSVEELTDEEMEKVQGGIRSTEKSIATTSYLQPSRPDGSSIVNSFTTFGDIYPIPGKPKPEPKPEPEPEKKGF